jgi:LysM repeat protein
LEGIQTDAILSIGQKLLIDPGSVTPTSTPRPMTALEELTPESDGKYYHVVNSGETLFWIASLYEISMNDLMAWNGLNADSILQPEQKLITSDSACYRNHTPSPVTVTLTTTAMLPTPTFTSPVDQP